MAAHYAVCSTSHFYSHLMNCLKQGGYKLLFPIVRLSSARSIVSWCLSHFFIVSLRGGTLPPIVLSSILKFSLWEPKDLNIASPFFLCLRNSFSSLHNYFSWRRYFVVFIIPCTSSRSALGSTKPHIQSVPGVKAAGAWTWPITSN
jgi:hypothetical protein